MSKGKQTCKILKDIRRQIAEANDIEYITSECQYKGDCAGTCPKCEAEVRYLEQQLESRRTAGKAVALAGISAGIIMMMPPAQAAIVSQQARQDTTIVAPIINQDIEEEVLWEGEVFDTIAAFPGGNEKLMEFLKREIRYPGYPKQKETVVYSIFIDKNGYTKVMFIASNPALDEKLAEECERILSLMPRWQPAVQNGKRIEHEQLCWINFTIDNTPNGDSEESKITPLNETDAEFPGGMAALMKFLRIDIKLNRPIYQGESDSPGRSIVQFTIDEEGNVRNPLTLRGIDPTLDKKALEIIKQMPKWKPATLRGKNIASRFVVPVTLTLQWHQQEK